MKKFTKESLLHYDGKDGRPAYVAVDGTVYDVTNNPHWTGGTHHGHLAGRDLSVAITHSPHGKSVLRKLNKVGTYSEN
ncbi:cytochrome b5 domain-containing protein [Lactobacillus acetotolerans]|uniref:cytochrome b5 domain-containing protein n=1 Tax=Lactobacillus acetotolerans TaxID=1600 RepID=UPI001451C7EF|nr:cytochrome b5 domain-containing protein [Lactobacillus acetotolerans]QJD72781.1 cytochrome B5 [Lactobacillus acetotolerans]